MTTLTGDGAVQTFLEKYLIFPKNFRKIASYLPYKACATQLCTIA